ncbi:MAG: polyribonucleotide nucleotidyltransferase [Chloroflexi bacterium]|nr:polyribonucleotide nucleotidyltransferase [Chloroflexota bacterium]
MNHSVQEEIAGRTLTIETGRLANLANGSVTVRYGDTVVLVTACAATEPREGVDFLPLTVDYEERLYAAGKIPGGYIKREGRPSQEATLAMRLTDRGLRPLFPKGFRNECQIVVTVLSTDQENDPDILSVIGASAALGISDIPFGGPIAATRMGYVDGELVVNPTFSQLGSSSLDLVAAHSRDAIVMVEAGAREIPEGVTIDALRKAEEINRKVIELQDKLIAHCGKGKMAVALQQADPDLEEPVSRFLDGRLESAVFTASKEECQANLDRLKKELVEQLGETFSAKELLALFEEKLKALVRRSILTRGIRTDGRDTRTIRPITCEVGILPRTHGSGLFTRGETQVLTIATLGSAREEQRLDTISPEESKRFMHHYNFPPFSTGEVGRLGSPRRREIGHGALAEKALLPVIPSETEFPYTIRLVSEVMSSNGSTSMASVCGSSLSLMDAGVPIKSPVAGAAMGLIMGDGAYAVLTDIAGIEDALGDMDFKVAGTSEGITALQMDIKIKGITYDVLEKALSQAKEARLFILDKMSETIESSRPELSRYAPRMTKIKVHPDKVRIVIGPGGKTIRSITDETKTTIDIEDDGTVIIGSTSEEATRKAISMIEDLTREVEVGVTYTGKVTRLMNFGAFVEILPGKEGLVHISELADYRVPSVEEVVKVGDEIMVKVIEIDRQGRINLSRRAVFQECPPEGGERTPVGAAPESASPRRPAGQPAFGGHGPRTGLRRPQDGERRGHSGAPPGHRNNPNRM